MTNKKFWLGILVLALALVFGMTVVGCDLFKPQEEKEEEKYDNRPSLFGKVEFDKKVYYPVVGETYTATFEKYSSSYSSDPIGTPSWKWYKTKEDAYTLSTITDKTQIGTGNTYTLKTTDVDYWIWAEVSYSGNSGTSASQISVISAVLSNPRISGYVSFDKKYPVVGEKITASCSGKGTASWNWYKTKEDAGYLSDIKNKTQIGNGNTYTVKLDDVGYWIWAEVSYSGNSGTASERTYSTVIGIPSTATVSVSVEATRALSSTSDGNQRVTVTLTLSDGRWDDVSYSTASKWLTITGTPSISSWGFYSSYYPYDSYPSVSAKGRKLEFSYRTNSDTILPINLTVALNTAQLSTMKSNTNVYNTLTAGTPSSVSISQWTIQ